MATDPLSTDPPVVTPPRVTPEGPREITCAACGCRLARNGEVLSTGDVYKKFLKHDQALEEKDREIARLQAEIADVKRERDTLRGSTGSAATRRVGQLVE